MSDNFLKDLFIDDVKAKHLIETLESIVNKTATTVTE